MKELGMYMGIVIMNNDPEKMGRVKVYVPGINGSMYDNWNGDPMNKEFSFIEESLIPILEPLREDLPWAECATGLFSGNTDKFNVNLTPEDLERPSDELVKAPPLDSFGYEDYTPGDYSGSAGGTYAIPNVGTHIYIFFRNGNINFPVYFASSHSKAEWERIFPDEEHYPTGFENERGGDYMNKQVLNSNKHTLEFIDSDELEEIKLSHFSGSNIAILNEYNSRYAVMDDLVLVEANKYTNVRETRNAIIEIDENIEIWNDRNTIIYNNENIAILNTETKDIVVDLIESIGGSVTRDVLGNVTLTIGGNLTIDVTGAVSIVAGGTILTEATLTNTVIGEAVLLNP